MIKILGIAVVLVVAGSLAFFWYNHTYTQEGISLPSSQEETRMIEDRMITDGVVHTIPLDEIISGGVPQDGIPSIDDPQFISVEEAQEWLSEEDPGIAVNINGVQRFYPYQILVWHEIVNDIVGGQGVVITYCPLCFSGIVFDSVLEGERIEFGVSGKLWNSNLLMYDRKTESMWSQILGEAVVGELAGTKLTVLPYDITTFGRWSGVYPEGSVLSRDTGALRFYGRDPYGDYYTNTDFYFPVGNRDTRLPSKEFVLGIVVGEHAKAYAMDAVREVGEIHDMFAGKDFIIRYEEELDVVRIFEQKESGELEDIHPFHTFWFTWAAVHPNTEVFPEQ